MREHAQHYPPGFRSVDSYKKGSDLSLSEQAYERGGEIKFSTKTMTYRRQRGKKIKLGENILKILKVNSKRKWI